MALPWSSKKADLLSAIDAFAFQDGGSSSSSASVMSRPSSNVSASSVAAASPPAPSVPRRAEAEQDAARDVSSAVVRSHIDADVDVQADTLLRGILDSSESSGRGSEPSDWREQLKLVLEVGARGTVQDFHEFLLGLLACSSSQRAQAEFVALVAAVLSAQTRDHTALAAVQRLQVRFGGEGGGEGDQGLLVAMASVEISVLEGCLRGVNFHKTKARSLKALASDLLAQHNGQVPRDLAALVKLPGVGPKIANLVRAVVFGGDVEECGMVVDTHVHRIAKRLGWTCGTDKTPEQTRRKLETFIPGVVREVVTRRLIAFGQEVCLARGPRCQWCPLASAQLCPSAFGTFENVGDRASGEVAWISAPSDLLVATCGWNSISFGGSSVQSITVSEDDLESSDGLKNARCNMELRPFQATLHGSGSDCGQRGSKRRIVIELE